MKPLLIISVILFVTASVIYWRHDQSKVDDKIHYHAGFQVYKDNQLVDFSDLKYMQTSPCTVDEQTYSPEDDQIEKAHLHSGVGDVVHVHRENALWGDLFQNLNYPIPASASAYLGGVNTPEFQTAPINPYANLIVLINSHINYETLMAQVPPKNYIEKVELQSEDCGKK